MLNVSTAYLTAVDNYIRDILTRVTFNGSTTLTNEVMSATVSEVGQSTDSITIGDLCTNSATVKFTMPTSTIPLENGYFQLEHGVLVGSEYVWIPMGTFYISEIETTEGSNKYTVKGFDRSTRLDKDYVPTVTLPTTVKAIVEDVCSQCNITLATYTFPNIAIETIYEGTCKDTLKYMAGLMGMNAKINRYDKLAFYWYGSSVRTIGQDIQFMGGFVKTTEEDIVIRSLTSGSEQNTLVSGNGRGISFENPYMTQSLLDGILTKVNEFTYTPAKIIYKGNPALEIGDVVSVEDRNGSLHTCIICEQEFVLTGMKSTINSKGGTEQETVMKQSPTEKKIKKMYNVMMNAFKDSTDLITGAKGGHFVIDYDENGNPTGFRIMDTPTLTDSTKLWIFNKNGFGFSANGGRTLKNIAIDMEGNINANVVNTGALVGEYFELNLETGSLIMGERGSNGQFINKWLEANEHGLSIGGAKEVEQVVTNVKVMYALGESSLYAPTSGWSEIAPTWEENKYMWQKTVIMRGNGETEEGEPTCISGASGKNAIHCTVESSNGFTIGEKVISTVLTARIYEGSTEKDSEGYMAYTWFISTDGGTTYSQLGVGKTITVSSSQIVDNTKIYFTAT